ncbi:MAG: hypothetical protein RBU45_23200 [Myxococcota bacterium]|jgi:hypothetical protein|nr:hypothetical protein [Myxococcota bacterium]
MLLLRPAEVEKLVRIVRLHHAAFLVEAFGPEAAGLDRASLRELVRLGLVDEEATAGQGPDPVGDAWLGGLVLARLRDLQDQADHLGEGLTYDQVEQELRRDPVPLGPTERRTLQAARNSAGQYCRGLGNTVDEELRAVAIEADDAQAAWFREHIEEATAEAIARRSTVDHLRSELGHRTDDWARDLERIAATELKNAHSEGVASYIEEEAGDQALVAKIPNPGACPSCLEAYTTDGATPRVFTLAALRANGSNVGRKARERKPVVESHHPHCDCELVQVPAGYTFTGRRLVRREALGEQAAAGSVGLERALGQGRADATADALREVSAWHPGWALAVQAAPGWAAGALIKGVRPPAGWSPAPHSRHGAYRRRRPGGGWEYWYPEARVTISAEQRQGVQASEVLSAIGDPLDQALIREAQKVASRLGISVHLDAHNFGIWEHAPDGSMTLLVSGRGRNAPTKVVALAAALGLLADQQAVLIVFPDPRGRAFRATIELLAPADPVKLFQRLNPFVVQGASFELGDDRLVRRVVIVAEKGSPMHEALPEIAKAVKAGYPGGVIEESCAMRVVFRPEFPALLRRQGLRDLLPDLGRHKRT